MIKYSDLKTYLLSGSLFYVLTANVTQVTGHVASPEV
jgi:hypothetical protein